MHDDAQQQPLRDAGSPFLQLEVPDPLPFPRPGQHERLGLAEQPANLLQVAGLAMVRRAAPSAHGAGGVRRHSGGMQWCMLPDLLPTRDAPGTEPRRWRHGPGTFLGRCRHVRGTLAARSCDGIRARKRPRRM